MPGVVSDGLQELKQKETDKLNLRVWDRKYTVDVEECSDAKKRTSESQPPLLPQGLVLIACSVQLFLASGTGFSLSIIAADLIWALNTSRKVAALPQSLYVGFMFSGGVLWSWLVKQVGPGPCVVAGALMMTLGFLAGAFSHNLILLIVCVGIISGLGSSILFAASYRSIAWTFRERRDLALIVCTFGVPIGSIVIPLYTEAFVEVYGWRGAFILIGGISLNGIVCGGLLYSSRDYFYTGNDSKIKSHNQSVARPLLTNFVFVFLIIMVMLAKISGVEPWMIVDFTRQLGYSRSRGSLLLVLIGAGNVLARCIALALRYLTRIPAVLHWVYLELLLAATHVMLVSCHSYPAMVCIIAIFSVPYGITICLGPVLVLEAVGLERFPMATGCFNCAIGIGTFIGDFVGGVFRDVTGSYNLLLYLCACSCVFISVSMLLMYFYLRYRGSVQCPYVVTEVKDNT